MWSVQHYNITIAFLITHIGKQSLQGAVIKATLTRSRLPSFRHLWGSTSIRWVVFLQDTTSYLKHGGVAYTLVALFLPAPQNTK